MAGSSRADARLSEVRFLTVAEVAELMRVSKMTVYRLVHSGDLTAVRVGRSFRVPEHAVHTYLREAFQESALTPRHARTRRGPCWSPAPATATLDAVIAAPRLTVRHSCRHRAATAATQMTRQWSVHDAN